MSLVAHMNKLLSRTSLPACAIKGAHTYTNIPTPCTRTLTGTSSNQGWWAALALWLLDNPCAPSPTICTYTQHLGITFPRTQCTRICKCTDTHTTQMHTRAHRHQQRARPVGRACLPAAHGQAGHHAPS
jgi:hypothetical protein